MLGVPVAGGVLVVDVVALLWLMLGSTLVCDRTLSGGERLSALAGARTASYLRPLTGRALRPRLRWE